MGRLEKKKEITIIGFSGTAGCRKVIFRPPHSSGIEKEE